MSSTDNSTSTTTGPAVTAKEETVSSTLDWGTPPPASAPKWDFSDTPSTQDVASSPVPADAEPEEDLGDTEELGYASQLSDGLHHKWATSREAGGWDRSGGW